MTSTPLPGRTERETHEYLRDHGHRLAAALAFHYHARRIETDDTYPLPDFSEEVIAAAGTDMQAVTEARSAGSQAYADKCLASLHGAVAEVHAEIYPARSA